MSSPTDKKGEAQRIMDQQQKQRDAGYVAGEIERDPFDIHWLNRERAALIVEALRAFAPSAVLEPVLCDSATAVCSICQEPVEQHRDIEALRAPTSSDLPLLPGTPRTDAAIKEATDPSRPDLLHYMNMTGVLNQLCRELEMELNAALAPNSATSPSNEVVPGTYWLVERGQPEGQTPTIWWVGPDFVTGAPYCGQWTEDASKARKFADRGCALSEIQLKCVHNARAAEHVFLNRG